MVLSRRPASAVIAALLLLISCAAAAGEAIGISRGGGQINCPCLGLDQVQPLTKEDQAIAETFGLNDTAGYGIGCAKHDYNNTGTGCSSSSPNDTSTFCGAEACYVDPLNCELPNRRSLRFPSSPRYFSYETCGYIDEWSRAPIQLRGKVLQGVLIDNHRGYEGTIIGQDDEHSSIMQDERGVTRYHDNKRYYGTVVDLMDYLETAFNFTINFTVVPEVSTNHAKKHQDFVDADDSMKHASCVYATGTSAVDLCIGAFTVNRERHAASSFLAMGVSSEYLVITSQPESPTAREWIRKIFRPFSLSLWAVNFVVLVILSLLFAIQEARRDWWRRFKEAPISSIFHASYNAFLHFWSQDTFLPSDGRVEDGGGTWAGRFTLLAIAVQILLTGASYTANLTNFLVRNGFESSIKSIDDAIEKKKTVCILRNRVNTLQRIYGNKIRNVTVDKRDDLLKRMDDGLCDCAIAGIEEMDTHHGMGVHCTKKRIGDPVLELPWGIPVSEIYSKPLETAISEIIQNGHWGRISSMHVPESICQAQVIDSETESLTPKHLLGAYVLSAGLVATGIIVSGIFKVAKKRDKSAGQSALHNNLPPATPCDPLENSSRMEDMYIAVAKLTEEMATLREKTTDTNDSLREILSSDSAVRMSTVK